VPEAGIAVHGYRLHYERDGQPRTVFIASSSHVCTTGAPGDCSFIEARP
jgi:hypothetical protein